MARLTCCIICLLIALPAGAAHAQAGGGFDLRWNSIDCGGAGGNNPSTGGGFALYATLGQPDAGALAGAAWELRGGYLAGGSPPPAPCYPDCNGDGVLNLADFGCFQTRFALADPRADCNGDGNLNLADFGCFQTKFAIGCP